MKNSDPKPPTHLSRDAKAWWTRITAEFDIDNAAALVLQSCLEAFDRTRDARAALKRDGLLVKDRFGQPKAHPAAAIERDSYATLLRGWRLLGLDIEPPGPIGRPPGK
jgi:P27 family predicted phage terminase small subunit